MAILSRFSAILVYCAFHTSREVLNGVGADGVGVKFPIFPVLTVICPLFEDKAKKSEKKGPNQARDCGNCAICNSRLCAAKARTPFEF